MTGPLIWSPGKLGLYELVLTQLHQFAAPARAKPRPKPSPAAHQQHHECPTRSCPRRHRPPELTIPLALQVFGWVRVKIVGSSLVEVVSLPDLDTSMPLS